MMRTFTRTVSPWENLSRRFPAASFFIASCSIFCSVFILRFLFIYILCPDIGAAGFRNLLGLFKPPRADLLVVHGKKHVRDGPAFPEGRSSIMRIFEQSSIF